MISILSLFLSCTPTESKQTDTGTETLDPTVEPNIDCPTDSSPSISSTLGCVIGTTYQDLELFLNIPYAKPPVGPNRWKRPISPEVWGDPLETTSIGNVCIQQTEDGMIGDEDCLNLNVIRPTDRTNTPLPILFFIHGGSFTNGAGSEPMYIDTPKLAEDSILVTHNYRLNSFGFLAHSELTNEDTLEYGSGSSGNQGLFDTLKALEWVHENATALGGDPDNIMIFGESAGAISTCALLTSPLANGLFSSVIMQSGNCLWFPELKTSTLYSTPAEELGSQLAESLDCEVDDLSCMRNKSASEILEALPEAIYRPNVDGVFLSSHPSISMYYGNFNKVPVVAGVTGNEGSMFVHGFNIQTEEELIEYLDFWAPSFGISDTQQLHTLYSTEEYDTPQEAFDQFYSDLVFVCPTKFVLESVSSHVLTYAYQYTHVPSWIDYNPLLEGWGSYHSSELPFVFGTYLDILTENELQLSNVLRTSWLSIAQNTPQINTDQAWLPFVDGFSEGGYWAQFNTTSTEMVLGVKKANCDFVRAEWYGQ
jgi:para-nitrobenzyl esterase